MLTIPPSRPGECYRLSPVQVNDTNTYRIVPNNQLYDGVYVMFIQPHAHTHAHYPHRLYI